MATSRQIEETVAWCVATVVLYHNRGGTSAATAQMRGEAEAIARQADALGLNDAVVWESIVRPLREELVARYGYELGPRLHVAFADALDAARAARGGFGRREVG